MTGRSPTDRVIDRRTRDRDAQRSKVYDAENLVHRTFSRAVEFPTIAIAGSSLTLPVERRFASLESVQAYVDAVLALNWVRQTWSRANRPVLVRARAGHASAHYERLGAVIAVPGAVRGVRWAMREMVVLHELTHHLEADEFAAPHGPVFVGRLIELVSGIVGAEAGFVLRVQMIDCGVAIG